MKQETGKKKEESVYRREERGYRKRINRDKDNKDRKVFRKKPQI